MKNKVPRSFQLVCRINQRTSIRGNTAQISRLLTIPGGITHLLALGAALTYNLEIRNRIYELALNHVTKTFPPVNIFHFGPSAKQDYKNGLLLGLTQTCKQLRTGFSPVYFATVTVAVHLSDLTLYTSTFLQPHHVGNVKIRYIDDCLPNIRSAIVLCGTAPRITIDFGLMSEEAIHVYSELSKRSELQTYIAERTYEVRLQRRRTSVVGQPDVRGKDWANRKLEEWRMSLELPRDASLSPVYGKDELLQGGFGRPRVSYKI